MIAVTLAVVRFHDLPDPGAESQQKQRPATAAARYIGSDSCASCHTEEAGEWQKSHHYDAMAQVTTQSVRGDFSNAKFNYAGITSTFLKRDGRFFVNTDGRDGKLADYEIK